MRDAIEERLTPADQRQWFPFSVEDGSTVHDYYAVRLERLDGLLDRTATVFNPATGDPIKAVVREEAIGARAIFSYDDRVGGVLLMVSAVRDALRSFSGVSFGRIRVTLCAMN
jgi:hypothetical protein